MPRPTARRTANIPIADVARIEPRSVALFFMIPLIHCRFSIADCRFCEQGESSNRQLAIGNWKYSVSYQGLTVSGFMSIFTAFATGKAGFVLRMLVLD